MSNTAFDSLAARRQSAARRCRQERVSLLAAILDADLDATLVGRTLRGAR